MIGWPGLGPVGSHGHQDTPGHTLTVLMPGVCPPDVLKLIIIIGNNNNNNESQFNDIFLIVAA